MPHLATSPSHVIHAIKSRLLVTYGIFSSQSEYLLHGNCGQWVMLLSHPIYHWARLSFFGWMSLGSLFVSRQECPMAPVRNQPFIFALQQQVIHHTLVSWQQCAVSHSACLMATVGNGPFFCLLATVSSGSYFCLVAPAANGPFLVPCQQRIMGPACGSHKQCLMDHSCASRYKGIMHYLSVFEQEPMWQAPIFISAWRSVSWQPCHNRTLGLEEGSTTMGSFCTSH